MDLLETLDALLKDIEAEARKAQSDARQNGERITKGTALERAIDTMTGKETN